MSLANLEGARGPRPPFVMKIKKKYIRRVEKEFQINFCCYLSFLKYMYVKSN